MQLNSKEVKQAWEDYKGFVEAMGLNNGNLKIVEQAFKFGYAKGAAEGSRVPASMPPLDQTPVNKELEMREISKRRMRSDEQRENDARLVASILQRNGRQMRLQEITEAVNNAGGDWYEKSASGHMTKAMEMIPEIKKVGFGVYAYKENGGV